MGKEFGQVSKDYDDIARELKLADDRANKAGSDAHHFESLLREEQAKLVKIDQAKKSLENEVRSLSVRIEEIETNSVATSKRTIQKMEVRIEELEVMINNEKKSHAATMTELHTKTRSIKELILQSEEDRKNIIILQDSLEKLNEKIKMYKRQLEEQESISNSNIMRVKKFQRELESPENRDEEAEPTSNQFRSRERVFASASARSEKSTDVQETEAVVKKTINKVNIGSPSVEEPPSSALASRGRPCRLRCWCRLLLKSGLGGQSGFHLQGVEQGQGWIYGQAWLLRQHLQRTGSQAEGDDQPAREGRPRLQGSRSG